MLSTEVKMICSELKGIQKELRKLTKEICLARISKGCEIKILEEENGMPSVAELHGNCFKLEPLDNPPQASDMEDL